MTSLHEQTDSEGAHRICAGCGAEAWGWFPAGWLIVPTRAPVGPRGLSIVIGERPYCLDCQHPELKS